MTIEPPRPLLRGKKALVVGIANEHSITYGCAKAFRELDAELAITYLNEKSMPYVEPLAKAMGAPILMPLDVSQPGQLEALFEAITEKWGRLDILDVGFTCAFLSTPYARRLTGGTVYVDGGVHIMA